MAKGIPFTRPKMDNHAWIMIVRLVKVSVHKNTP